ncbi:LOW QUALITY PROTEIN: hypothetical protein PoB_002265400 [Plakobranchus ocellatus]|uniref:Uncharacterized protein n=1 Tax=Plakobranchus ocellatus TaxID=259542 RepID=A0AAV3ZLG3_9GAST|nr:LOW QUALITY PROTEIN: hypothetical protein PoB_002265400 [Plakobranchus ocellatus]
MLGSNQGQNTCDKTINVIKHHFYSDKNNMAMYCVLPIMVLIYGGCASIYCIHKCRLYIRRKKHKRLKEEDCDSLNSDKNESCCPPPPPPYPTEGLTLYIRRKKHKRLKEEDCDSLNSDKNDLNKDDTGVMVVGGGDLDPVQNRSVSQMSQAWADLEGQTWSGQTEAAPEGGTPSPLPWQVSEKATAAQENSRENTSVSRASYLQDKLRNDDVRGADGTLSPSYEMTSQASYYGVSRSEVSSSKFEKVSG